MDTSLFPPTTITTHPDSGTSSPRSRPDTACDEHRLAPVPGAKLRLMCSYGGHIIPRPHDKSLCYVGGDTRIVVVERRLSLSELHSRLSHTLLNGRHFTLKYQLPREDLDSLISLATDEDLENMIEEYDRKPSRLRLFLFPSKPETTASMGSLLDDAKSETWFVDALNGAGLLPRGLSESAAMDTLLELDRGLPNTDSSTDLEAQNEPENNKQGLGKSGQEVVETSSSFESSSSSPSMGNLTPIKVRGDEDYNLMVGLDEQFSHVSIVQSCGNARSGGEDEKWEKVNGKRKPPLPLLPVQRKLLDIHNLPSPDSKHAPPYNLTSPDSVASDSSIASAMYHDATQLVNRENRAPPTLPTDPKMSNNTLQDPITTSQQQLVDSMTIPPQQFIQGTHYIQQHPINHVPVPSYYTMYVHPQTQTQQTDPQYQMYMYQPSYEATSSRPLTPPLPPVVYPTKPEMAPNMQQMLLQVPPQQYQQHYIGVSQIPPPPQSNASTNSTSNCGYECHHHMQDQGFYSQQPPPQYQTMTPAAAVMFSQASNQLPTDNNGQQS